MTNTQEKAAPTLTHDKHQVSYYHSAFSNCSVLSLLDMHVVQFLLVPEQTSRVDCPCALTRTPPENELLYRVIFASPFASSFTYGFQ